MALFTAAPRCVMTASGRGILPRAQDLGKSLDAYYHPQCYGVVNRGKKSHGENKDACSLISKTEEQAADKDEDERSNEAEDLGWVGKKWKADEWHIIIQGDG